MASILLSVQPKWIEKILNGEKTIEIRKTAPKCELPIEVYIYCTKAKNNKEYYKLPEWFIGGKIEKIHGKVVAKFTLRDATEFDSKDFNDAEAFFNYGNEVCDKACLCLHELNSYVKGKFYAWHISDLQIFDKPMELGELRAIPTYMGKDYKGSKELTRPPQSWQYVEVAE